ncbi:MAG: DUF2817 domain-containing protein [Myxococcota bacterium]|nr:DUF2817 domain-containing protein [Myxococcota bacterium]
MEREAQRERTGYFRNGRTDALNDLALLRSAPRLFALPHTLAVALVLVTLVGGFGAGCARLALAPRYLSRCPAEGPEPTSDLGIRPIPLDLAAHYAELASYADRFDIEELGRMPDSTVADGVPDEYPILQIQTRNRDAAKRMLIVAGIHGNEAAGLLAVPRILDLLEEQRPVHAEWSVTVITPANPIGVVHGSRYNAQGCDINRDFQDSQTLEARLLQDAIASERPDLIVSLHEGAQAGFMLVVTSMGSEESGRAVVEAVRERGIPISDTHFLGFALGTPGLSKEGRFYDWLKAISRHYTLGLYATRRGVGAYTTESDWAATNLEQRVWPHVIAVEALLAPDP